MGSSLEVGTNTEIGIKTKKGTETKIEKARRLAEIRWSVSPLEYAFILVPNRRKGNKKTPRKWRSLFVQFTASCLQLCKSEKSYGKRC